MKALCKVVKCEEDSRNYQNVDYLGKEPRFLPKSEHLRNSCPSHLSRVLRGSGQSERGGGLTSLAAVWSGLFPSPGSLSAAIYPFCQDQRELGGLLSDDQCITPEGGSTHACSFV